MIAFYDSVYYSLFPTIHSPFILFLSVYSNGIDRKLLKNRL